jgi:8-oxo-dGTP pyrophosphatase MutT (NUDIX family)
VLEQIQARLLAVEDALRLYGNASAAVAILLRERTDLEVLVMERAKRETDPWSGHWSFPGGRRQAGEPLMDAVCRETEEEIGVRPDPRDVLGCIAARSPANRPEVLVLPFVFRFEKANEPKPGPEVASIAWVSIAELVASRTTATIRIRGREAPMPAFVREGRTIWGFTYRLLEDFVALLV